jgi:hypothetical protein
MVRPSRSATHAGFPIQESSVDAGHDMPKHGEHEERSEERERAIARSAMTLVAERCPTSRKNTASGRRDSGRIA